MAQFLTGNTVSSTYGALIKVGNNAPITASLTVLSDGLGNELPVEVSTSTFKVTGTLDTTTGVINVAAPTANSNATTKLYVDTEVGNEETARINADSNLQSQITTNAGDISTLDGQVITIFGWTLNNLALSDSITIVGAGTVAVTDDGNNTITITGSGGGGAVDSVNSLTGALTIEGTNGITVTDDGTDTITIDGSSVVGAVTSVNGDTGAVQVEAVYQTVKNASGAIMYRGTPVHTTGVTSGQQPDVIPADASSNYPADYILNEDINIGASGQAISMGLIEDVNLTPFGGSASAFSPGDEVYLAAGGGFTITRPTGTNAVQPLGRVLKVNVGGNQISGKIDNLGHANIDDHGLPNLPQNYLWQGDSTGVPVATDRESILVGYATNAINSTNADKVDINTAGSAEYGIVLHQGAPGTYKDLYADSETNTPTWHTGTNLMTMANANVTTNLQAGTVTDVEQSILDAESDITTLQSDVSTAQSDITTLQGDVSQNTSDIAALQAIPQVAPIVNETISITISDDTYNNKFVVFDSAGGVDVELDNIQAWEPTVGTEIYFMHLSNDVTIIGNPTVLIPSGKVETSRGANSVIGIKCIDAGSAPSTEATWVLFGDLADA